MNEVHYNRHIGELTLNAQKVQRHNCIQSVIVRLKYNTYGKCYSTGMNNQFKHPERMQPVMYLCAASKQLDI